MRKTIELNRNAGVSAALAKKLRMRAMRRRKALKNAAKKSPKGKAAAAEEKKNADILSAPPQHVSCRSAPMPPHFKAALKKLGYDLAIARKDYPAVLDKVGKQIKQQVQEMVRDHPAMSGAVVNTAAGVKVFAPSIDLIRHLRWLGTRPQPAHIVLHTSIKRGQEGFWFTVVDLHDRKFMTSIVYSSETAMLADVVKLPWYLDRESVVSWKGEKRPVVIHALHHNYQAACLAVKKRADRRYKKRVRKMKRKLLRK